MRSLTPAALLGLALLATACHRPGRSLVPVRLSADGGAKLSTVRIWAKRGKSDAGGAELASLSLSDPPGTVGLYLPREVSGLVTVFAEGEAGGLLQSAAPTEVTVQPGEVAAEVMLVLRAGERPPGDAGAKPDAAVDAAAAVEAGPIPDSAGPVERITPTEGGPPPDARPVDAMCGLAGLACCPQGDCGRDACCGSQGKCVASGQPCGPSRGVCHDAVCGPIVWPNGCGGPGQPCCDPEGCASGGCCAGGVCVAPGTACTRSGGGVCQNGSCGDCGNASQRCCVTNGLQECTAPYLKCEQNLCVQCGSSAFGCCWGHRCGPELLCNTTGATAGDGACLPCGSVGEACCPGNLCKNGGCCAGDNKCVGQGVSCGPAGTTCQAGACQTCGGMGQACCGQACTEVGAVCRMNICTACGGPTQPCCADQSCHSGGCCVAGKCQANGTTTCPNGQRCDRGLCR